MRRLLAAAVFSAAGVAAIILSSCAGPAAERVVERQVPVPVVKYCARTAPPVWEPVPAPKICLRGYQCYPTSDGATLAGDIDALRSWAREIWALCAPPAGAK